MASLGMFSESNSDSTAQQKSMSYNPMGTAELGPEKYLNPTFGRPSTATFTLESLGYGYGDQKLATSHEKNMAIFPTETGNCNGMFVDGKCVPYNDMMRDVTAPSMVGNQDMRMQSSERNDQASTASEKAGGVDKQKLAPPKREKENMKGQFTTKTKPNMFRDFFQRITGYTCK